jgi:hypothetical protein
MTRHRKNVSKGPFVSIYFGDEIKKELDGFCDEHNLSYAEVVRAAVNMYLERIKEVKTK